MAVEVSYPGVYVEEFAPGAPIQGVGTSTAAFIGPAARGELDKPTKLTSWDQFLQTFGEQPLPGFFLWYAARGFFENGGRVCYVVRASNGAYATAELVNRDGLPAIRLRARQPGVPNPDIKVSVSAAHVIQSSATELYRPTDNFTVTGGQEVQLTSNDTAAQFRPGDWVSLSGIADRLLVASVSGRTLRLSQKHHASNGVTGAIRLSDALATTRSVRIFSTGAPIPPGALVPGTMLTITQGTVSTTQVVESVHAEHLQTTPAATTYRVTFRQGLGVTLDMTAAAAVQSEEFDIGVAQGGSPTVYGKLSPDPAHPRYFAAIVNSQDGLVRVEPLEPPPPTPPPAGLPDDQNVTLNSTGADEDLGKLTAQDYIDALDTLRHVDDVNLIAIPDCVTLRNASNLPDEGQVAAVQQALIAHCELMAERFAVLDARPGLDLFGDAASVEAQRLGLDSTRGYAALYYPWLRVRPQGPGAPVLVPPSGHVCGIIARSDTTRGVHKAPANETVNGALGVERNMTDVEQGQLNLQGVNVIRVFQTGGRPVLWGARTTATDRNWQYVNVRRLFLYVEESIEEGIRWAVFEPNNLQLWQKLRRTITEFLTRVWRDGGLFGATAAEAFYVRIDEVLNPFSEQALGRLYIEIGLRPSYPAEFIIVRIGIWQGGGEVSEG